MKEIRSSFFCTIFKSIIFEKVYKIWQLFKENLISGNRHSMYFFLYMKWWYSTMWVQKMTPSSIVSICAVQRISSPKTSEKEFCQPPWGTVAVCQTSLCLDAKAHHMTLNALTVIWICKSDLQSLDPISASLWFCAVGSLHFLNVITHNTLRLHQNIPESGIKWLVSFSSEWLCCESRTDPIQLRLVYKMF